MHRLLPSLLLLAGCSPTHVEHADRTAVTVRAIPLETLDGHKAPLEQHQAKRPTLIAMWATWCDTCATEFDALAKLAPKAEAQGAYVVAVSEGEPRATVADFVKARALGYPQLVDEAFALADAIGARSVPTTVVLDRKGEIVFRGAGLDRAALVALDRAIAKP